MKWLYNIISWAGAQAVLALICFLLYEYVLQDLFKVNITYIQWLAMIIIGICVLPGGNPLNTENEPQDPKSKLDNFVSSLVKRHEH